MGWGVDSGQRLGSGSSKSPYFKSAQTMVFAVVEADAGDLRLAHFLTPPEFS